MRTNTKEFRGLRVVGGRSGRKRIGKVLRAVFSEDYLYLGLVVARPDLLFMFKRKDRFLAHDAFRIEDGRVVATIDRDSWDNAACKRLGVDWDLCLILEGMPVITSNGDKLGHIDTVNFDQQSRETFTLQVTEGMAARAIVGTADIPVNLLEGYRDGYMTVKGAAAKIKAEGGLAAKAGEQSAIAAHAIKEKTKDVRAAAAKVTKQAGESAGKAIDGGSKALGKQLGRTKGMFKAFKEEYKKAASKD